MRPRLSVLASCFRQSIRNASGHARIGRLSVAIRGNPSQQTVIEKLQSQEYIFNHKSNSSEDSPTQNAALVLASPDFATWLEDESFMSSFLSGLFARSTVESNRSAPSSQLRIDVLSGVVDGLSPRRLLGKPEKGFSVLYGPEMMLSTEVSVNEMIEPEPVSEDRAASIRFSSWPLERKDGALDVTLPLANTIFQNGRRSTLLVSRWKSAALSGSFAIELKTMAAKQHQRIVRIDAMTGLVAHYIPLLPLTSPRKIVSGLGNIVRQVDINGVASPASKELELLIPKVFDNRSEIEPGPIGVWAWVVPAQVANDLKLSELRVLQDHLGNGLEQQLSRGAAETFQRLLSSGCRLHKILSGGGGWGAKQGLLSLDPETSYSAAEDDSIEMFIKSFQERKNQAQSEGLVTPGSYILFCIEPALSKGDVDANDRVTSMFTLGVAPKNEDGHVEQTEEDGVEVNTGRFGVVSSGGVYLQWAKPCSPEGGVNGNDEDNEDGLNSSKVDVPGTLLTMEEVDEV